MYKNFPIVSGVLNAKEPRDFAKYAVVMNGRLIATDAYILVELRVSEIVPKDQVEFLEGKVFGIDLLKMIEKAKVVKFQAEDIIIDSVKVEYTGTIDAGNYEVSLKNGKEFKYVAYTAIIPKTTYPTEIVGVDPKGLVRILNCFKCENLRLELAGTGKNVIALNPIFDEGLAVMGGVKLKEIATEKIDDLI